MDDSLQKAIDIFEQEKAARLAKEIKPEPEMSDSESLVKAMQLFDEENSPGPIPSSRVDNKESDKIALEDRIMALNVGDPTGAINKFRADPKYKDFKFKSDESGEIVFKSPKATGWSGIDPKEPAASYSPFPNAIFTKDLGRDLLDIAPDVVQTGVTTAAALGGSLAGGLGLGTAFAGLTDAAAETLRQNVGKITGWRDAPMSGGDIAFKGGVAALSNLVGGTPISKKTAEEAAKGTTNWARMRTSLPSWAGGTKEAEKRGVEVLNPGYGIETPQSLPKNLEPLAVEKIQDSARGVVPRLADVFVERATRIDPESQKRASEPLAESVKKTLKDAGVTFSVNKNPKNYIDVAEEVYTQNAGGKIIDIVREKALNAVKKSKREVGTKIEEGLKKSKSMVDLSEEKAILDKRIADLKATKAADTTGATHFDDDIAAMEDLRNTIFGSSAKQKTRQDLGKATIEAVNKGMLPEDAVRLRESVPESIYAFLEGPAKQPNLVVPASVAFEKLKALANQIEFGKSVNGKSAAELTKRAKAIEAWDLLAGKIDTTLAESGVPGLRNTYKKHIRNEKAIEKLFSNVNTGLSTAKSAFNTSKGHIKRDILDFDKDYGTNILGDLTIFDVAKVHGAPDSWFPKSINGTTSTSADLTGQAMASAFTSAIQAEKGGLIDGLSKFAGGLLTSSKASSGLLKAQRAWKEAAAAKNAQIALPLSQIPASVWKSVDNRSKEKR